jgi:CheY-like chemotaxis protein
MERKRILIADDETHILNVVSLKLKNAGFEVVTAEDGSEAFHLAVTTSPDLIITDYQMPQLSGVELGVRLSSRPGFAPIPTILLTARGFSITEEDKMAANILEIIHKPFSPRMVLESVQQRLEASTLSEDAVSA